MKVLQNDRSLLKAVCFDGHPKPMLFPTEQRQFFAVSSHGIEKVGPVLFLLQRNNEPSIVKKFPTNVRTGLTVFWVVSNLITPPHHQINQRNWMPTSSDPLKTKQPVLEQRSAPRRRAAYYVYYCLKYLSKSFRVVGGYNRCRQLFISNDSSGDCWSSSSETKSAIIAGAPRETSIRSSLRWNTHPSPSKRAHHPSGA